MSKKNTGVFKKIIGLAIGAGAVYAGGKKLLDLYMEMEAPESINEQEYLKEIQEYKAQYIDINTGKIEIIEDFRYLVENIIIEDKSDELFVEFLKKAEEFVELPNMEFKISDIGKIINVEYDDRDLMKMLSEKKGYVDFVFPDMSSVFNDIEKIENLNRYGEEKFRISSRFIKLISKED